MNYRIAILIWLVSASVRAQPEPSSMGVDEDAPAAVEELPMWADEVELEATDAERADSDAPKLDALVVVPADGAVTTNVDVDVDVEVEVPPTVEPEEPRAKTTHFFYEAAGGVSFAGDVGASTNLLLGLGGKRSGGFLRFYLLGGLQYSTLPSSAPRDGLAYEGSTRAFDLLVGLRVYVPLLGPIRLFTDVLVGGAFSRSTVSGGPLASTSVSGSGGVAIWGFGLQVRVTRQLALGGRLGLRWAADPLEELRARVGLRDERRSAHLTGSVAWMF